jgi:hypothetical protein
VLCSDWNRFGFKVEFEAVYQHGNLLDSIQTVFLPNLAELRMSDEFAEEIVVFLMNNCSSHISDDLM